MNDTNVIEYLTTDEVARMFDLSRSRITRMRLDGQIHAINRGGVWFYPPDAIEAIRHRNTKPGIKPKRHTTQKT